MVRKNNYWAEREKAEKKWQKEQEKNLKAYNKGLADLYQKVIDNINREIKADVGFANGKLIKADSMKEYETLAKQAVAKAEAMRAKGHHVTRKDFSKDVNDRLKIYNATMRINRNEILKSMIGEQLVELGIEQEGSLTNKLWNDYLKEKERQAGILGVTTKDKTWSSEEIQKQVYASIANANFSKRIWADIDGLKGTLDGLVSTAIIRGDNPKEMTKWLTGMVSAVVGNQKYVAERLARTETARIQTVAAKSSFKAYGYKYVKWYAEGEACKYCREIAYDDNGWGEGIYKIDSVPDIPVHPNCMCSIGAYWVDDAKSNDHEDDIEQDVVEDHGYKLGKPMTIEEADHMNGNPYGWGNTPKERQDYIKARQAVDSYKADVSKLKEGWKQKPNESRDEWVKRVHEVNDKIQKRHDQYLKDWEYWHKLYEKVYPYRINCQRCAPTYEMRRRGYKVIALPFPDDGEQNTKLGFRIPAEIFLNDDGSVSKPERLKAGSNRRVTAELMKKMQIGERGTIDWAWSGRGNTGHIINVERTEDGLKFVDAQNDIVTDSFEEYMDGKTFKKRVGSGPWAVKLGVKYNRTDNKGIDWFNIDKVVKPSD